MSTGKLTVVEIKNAKPREKSYKLFDGGGLYLEVAPTGGKWWRLKYRIGSKEKRISLGVFPKVSLAEARKERDKAKRLLQAGIDPAEERKARKLAEEKRASTTFERVAKEWIDKQVGRWTEEHAKRVLQSLAKDLFPVLGHRPVAEISPKELLQALRAVEARGALDVASRLLQRSGAVFRYGIAAGYCDRNPAADLQGALKTRKVTHRPALKEADLPEFLAKLDAYDGHLLTKLALRFLLLTFVRPGELRAAEWQEFQLEGDAPTWRIPAERMKMREEHIVPLSRQAVAVLQEIHALTGNGRLVFPQQNKPEKPMSENTLLYAMYRMGYHQRATPHGFRATASTILNEMGWRPDVIERQLAHAERNKVRAAYHRSEYLADRRKMMQAWADYLDQLAAGDTGKVVPIRAAS